MPSGPLGGPRPFADSKTQVLLDMSVSDPATGDIDEMELEDMVNRAGVKRGRIYTGFKRAGDMEYRVIITYGDRVLSVPEASEISSNVRSEMDRFFDQALGGSYNGPAPYFANWKCSTVPDLVSGKDVQDRVERSAKRAMNRIKSGVEGPSGVPRPFANPEGLVIEYTLTITGVAIDTQRVKDRLLNMETGGNIPTYSKKVKVKTGDVRGELKLYIDEGTSGSSTLDVISFNREVPKRIKNIEGVEIKDSRLRCGK